MYGRSNNNGGRPFSKNNSDSHILHGRPQSVQMSHESYYSPSSHSPFVQSMQQPMMNLVNQPLYVPSASLASKHNAPQQQSKRLNYASNNNYNNNGYQTNGNYGNTYGGYQEQYPTQSYQYHNYNQQQPQVITPQMFKEQQQRQQQNSPKSNMKSSSNSSETATNSSLQQFSGNSSPFKAIPVFEPPEPYSTTGYYSNNHTTYGNNNNYNGYNTYISYSNSNQSQSQYYNNNNNNDYYQRRETNKAFDNVRATTDSHPGSQFNYDLSNIDISAIKKNTQIPREEMLVLRHAFNLFDRNGDGEISTEELQTVLKSLRLASDQELMILCQQLQTDGLSIDFFDFVKLLRSEDHESSGMDSRKNSSVYDKSFREANSNQRRLESMPVTKAKKTELERSTLTPLTRFRNFLQSTFSRKKKENSGAEATTNATTTTDVADENRPNNSKAQKRDDDDIASIQQVSKKFLSYNSKDKRKPFGTQSQMNRTTRLQEMQQVFSVFDSDRDGYVTLAEMKSVMNQLGMNMAIQDSEVRELFKLVGHEGDNKLSFQDFITLFNMCS